MQGYIPEKTNRLTDGIGSVVKLLLVYALTSLLVVPIRTFFKGAGVLIYLIILLAIAGIELQSTLLARTSDPKRAWHGLSSGLLFWQVIRFTVELSTLKFFEGAGILFWVALVMFIFILWRRVLPIGVQSASLVLLTCWLGEIYQVGFTYLSNWPPFISFGYQAIRWIIGILGLVALILMIFKAHDLNTRIYCAVAIFASILTVFMIF
jgi:hypothetical protein